MKAVLVTLSEFISQRIGVSVDIRRQSAIESRLAPVLAEYGLKDLRELATRLRAGADAELADRTIDAMVTCETLFFRDRAPFAAMRSLMLPKLREARSGSRMLRIWSAACATGQEPYSLAMMLDEQARNLSGWRVDLIASDISRAALAIATAGCYSQFEVQRGLPTPLLLRHFAKEQDGWRINEHLRASVDFRRVNLTEDFAKLGRFDIILCRNALMYMDVERRCDVLRRLSRQLAPDGYLMLGATETVIGLGVDLVPTPDHIGLFTRAQVDHPKLRLVAAS
jgi:chemotaxis protein methyltransferase CheR